MKCCLKDRTWNIKYKYGCDCERKYNEVCENKICITIMLQNQRNMEKLLKHDHFHHTHSHWLNSGEYYHNTIT